jgi:hypothetical protein
LAGDAPVVDRIEAMRGAAESDSNTILRLVEMEESTGIEP